VFAVNGEQIYYYARDPLHCVLFQRHHGWYYRIIIIIIIIINSHNQV
jgi:hypothetical protein